MLNYLNGDSVLWLDFGIWYSFVECNKKKILLLYRYKGNTQVWIHSSVHIFLRGLGLLTAYYNHNWIMLVFCLTVYHMARNHDSVQSHFASRHEFQQPCNWTDLYDITLRCAFLSR